MADIAELMWAALQDQIAGINRRIDDITVRSERAEVADSLPAYTFANLPTAVGGGLGDNVSYTTLAWCSNGRKAGEGVGAGTGILCYWDVTSASWKGVKSELDVTV